MSRASGALALLLLSALAGAAMAQSSLDAARAVLGRYHEDLGNLDRARDLLMAAPDGDTNAAVAAMLARTWFLIGEFRASGRDERLAAYERGREAGRRAMALSPGSDVAHTWYAINTARWAETRGIMRAASTVPTLRAEAQTILSLNPDSVEGHTLAGGLAAELPAMLGGDRGAAEKHFRRALKIDPRSTGARVELARLYIATRRYGEAQHELELVLDEPAASDLPYWTLRDMPRARALLESIGGRPERREAP